MRRIAIPLLAGLLALSALAPVAAAQEEPSHLYPCIPGLEYTAEPGQPLDFFCGWATVGGPGKIVSGLSSTRQTLTVVDEDGHEMFRIDPEEFASLWTGRFVGP